MFKNLNDSPGLLGNESNNPSIETGTAIKTVSGQKIISEFARRSDALIPGIAIWRLRVKSYTLLQ